MAYTQIIYHIIFGTKNRARTLDKKGRKELFQYIHGILKNKRCYTYQNYQINGVEDHIHILSSLHPSLALADLIKSLKISSNKWIKENKVFPMFDSWQAKYGAVTCSFKDKDRIIEYIKNQEEHHKKVTFTSEYLNFLEERGIHYDERFLFE